jgi:FKBP-type peptidyl-prolyl cis-trans isomerase FkpA
VKKILACVTLALAAVSCDQNGGGGSPTDPSQVTVEFTTVDLLVGTGAEAVPGVRATFANWELFLYNPNGPASKGASIQNQNTILSNGLPAGPIIFTVASGTLIPGFDQGVRGMRVGGRRRIYVPPNMAYGSSGSGGQIPPNASIVFEVELTSVVQP